MSGVTEVSTGQGMGITEASKGRGTEITEASKGRGTEITEISTGRSTGITEASTGRSTGITEVSKGQGTGITEASTDWGMGIITHISTGRSTVTGFTEISKCLDQHGQGTDERGIEGIVMTQSCSIPLDPHQPHFELHRPLSIYNDFHCPQVNSSSLC